MGWVFAALIVVLIGFIFVTSLGRLGEMAPQIDDRPTPRMPADRELTSDDLAAIRFAVVARGYSMEQVDAVLERVREQLGEDASGETGGPDGVAPMVNGWPSAI